MKGTIACTSGIRICKRLQERHKDFESDGRLESPGTTASILITYILSSMTYFWLHLTLNFKVAKNPITCARTLLVILYGLWLRDPYINPTIVATNIIGGIIIFSLFSNII